MYSRNEGLSNRSPRWFKITIWWDANYRSHHEIDTVIGHSLGGAVALSKEKQHLKKKCNNPYGIVQSKTFGAPTVSGNIRSPILKDIIKNEIVGAGVGGGLAIGTSADSAIGFADGGLCRLIIPWVQGLPWHRGGYTQLQ